MTRSPRTILGGLMVLGSWLWVASETVNDHPTFAAVVVRCAQPLEKAEGPERDRLLALLRSNRKA